MLSWLGFGQDKKELVTEESSQAVDESTAEPELIVEAKQNEAIIDEANVDETIAIAEVIIPDEIEPESSTPEQSEQQLEELTVEKNKPKELEASEEPVAPEVNEPVQSVKLGFFARLKQGLSKTRKNLGGGLFDLFRGKQIDDELFDELETHLFWQMLVLKQP